jgi:hypothetical protein
MKSIEEWTEVAANGKPPESELALTYKKAVEHIEREQQRLLRYLRVRDGQVVVLPDVEKVQQDIQRADEAVEQTRRDIQTYLGCLGNEFNSVQSMTERLARLKRKRDTVIHDVDSLAKQAVNRGVAPDRVMDDSIVAAAADKRDRVVAEVAPEIESLSKRLTAAQAILGKY